MRSAGEVLNRFASFVFQRLFRLQATPSSGNVMHHFDGSRAFVLYLKDPTGMLVQSLVSGRVTDDGDVDTQASLRITSTFVGLMVVVGLFLSLRCSTTHLLWSSG